MPESGMDRAEIAQAEHRILRVSPLPKFKLQKVQRFVEAKIAEPILLQEMAGSVGLSSMHFAAQFRLATGMPPKAFVVERRIEAAKRMLLQSDHRMGEIARLAGFGGQSYFATAFRRSTGCSPLGFRRRAQRSIVNPQREA